MEDPVSDQLRDDALPERLRAALSTLEALVADRGLLVHLAPDEQQRLINAAGEVFDPDFEARRRFTRARNRQRRADKANAGETVLEETGIRALRRQPVFNTPNYTAPKGFIPEDIHDETAFRTSVEDQYCYVCKKQYHAVHHFYDQLCPECATFNFYKRTELADLTGRVALLTGGRLKIGYQAGLKLLRCGAKLLVTTRFPRDSAARYAGEPDFAEWGHRLQIFGLDLRHTASVEAFCQEMLATQDRLDFIINNACQTVRRPPEFYEHMMAGETSALRDAPSHVRQLLGAYEGMRGTHLLGDGTLGDTLVPRSELPLTVPGFTHAAELSQLRLLPEEQQANREALFPVGRLDQDLQQVDLRGRNSWRLLMAEVSSVELLEVQLVNAIAPFILNARLKPLMLRTPERDKHVVNVSAVEGQFYRKTKTTRHPHTNMAKAALNMMTRTSAADYFQDGIHMNSVDTGWVTDEDPAEIASRKVKEHRFHPPLDIVDGGARIVDPIIDGVNTGAHVWGAFLKDYKPTDW